MTPNEIVYDNPLNSQANRRAEPPGLFSTIHIYWKRITQFDILILNYLRQTTWSKIVIWLLTVLLDPILRYLTPMWWFPIPIWMLTVFLGP